MENYTKSSSQDVEAEGYKPSEYFKNLAENFLHVRVKRGSKLRNILGFAIKAFQPDNAVHLVCSANGPAVSKAISCVEIIKRKFKNLYQITKIHYIKVEDTWEPNKPELDKLKVTREVPSIHVLLSKEKLNPDEPGYQAPGKSRFLSFNAKAYHKNQEDSLSPYPKLTSQNYKPKSGKKNKQNQKKE